MVTKNIGMRMQEFFFFLLGRSKWDTLCSCFYYFRQSENIALLHFKRKTKKTVCEIRDKMQIFYRELTRDRANSKVDKSEFYSKKNSKRGRMRGKLIISSINFM